MIGLLVCRQEETQNRQETPANPNDFDPYFLILLTYIVAAKGYNNAGFASTLKNRFEVFCARVGISKYSLPVSQSTYETIGDFMSSPNGVWKCLGKYLFSGWPNVPVLIALRDQVKLSCEWGGLAGLKMAHDFVSSDQSSVWLLAPVCHQAQSVIKAWKDLQKLDNPPYARMLGHSCDSWTHRMYPDILYCAKKVKMATESSIKNYELGEITTEVPRHLLDESLKMNLDTKPRERESVVQEVLDYKGLCEKQTEDANAKLEKMLRQILEQSKQ